MAQASSVEIDLDSLPTVLDPSPALLFCKAAQKIKNRQTRNKLD